MTKKYWLGVMIFSLLMLGGSGYFIWTTLQQKNAHEVPLTQIPANTDQNSSPSVASSSTIIEPVQASPSSDVLSQGQNHHASSKRNILFTYRKASAKEVFIIGTFNQWNREPMKKNDKGLWEYATKLAPGHYEYKFVVDDRKIKDPNNRLYTPKGNSILKVKPIANQ